VLKLSGVRGGVVVHVPCGDGALLAQIARRPGFTVHGIDTDAARVATARKTLASVYGRASADRWDGKSLPYVDNFVNLIVAEGPVPKAELLRVLVPEGVACVREGDGWAKIVKPRPANIDDWTHYFHSASGNPVSNDTAVGPPRRLQWVGGPRWARHHDHMASMTSLVAAKGRLFYIFDEGNLASIQYPSHWRLTARDAFNGTILWKREIDRWNTRQWPLKSGPAHLTRRLVAVGDRVYTTLSLDAPAAALDAASGKTLLTYAGSERTREILVTDGCLLALVGLAPSRLPEFHRQSTYVWDNTRRANQDWAWGGEKRRIMAFEADSGKPLWQVEAPVAPCSLASDGARVVYYDGQKVACRDHKTGKPLWTSEPIRAAMPVQTSTGPRTLLYDDVVLFAGNTGQMTALDAKTGKTLWQAKKEPSGHMSLKDLFVVQGQVWSAAIANGRDPGTFTGRNFRTGKVETTFPEDVKIYWFHHRCYPSKATTNYILTSRNGIEFVDPKAKHWETHHWVRGGCIYGILPCNGLTYAPMNSCGCYLESKLNGFNALAPGPVPQADPSERLEKGPAYGAIPDAKSQMPDSQDWPTYRHDPSRSGSTPTALPAGLGRAWRTKLGGRLSAPVIAEGRIYVAAVDAHTVHALDAASGKALWACTVGGRVDSPPTVYKGLVLFGSADGYVYALRATDGARVWRYRAAPADRRHMVLEQIESVWPVHGSVLVEDGVLTCTAGRSIFLDGGIHFLRLDPLTGKKLGEVVWDERDPASGKNMQMYVQGLSMPVALSDLLSSDGKHLYMRSQKITREGERLEIPLEGVDKQPAEGSHLFCQIGFLDDSWFHRSFWTFGRRVNGGYGGWFQAGRMVPAGRILVFDEEQVYGYGRKPQYYVNASVLEHHLFAAEKFVKPEVIAAVRQATFRMNARSTKRNATSSYWKLLRAFPEKDVTAARYAWALDQPAQQVRAMVAAGDALVVAGHPDVIDERRAYRLYDDPETLKGLAKQEAALSGALGGRLWVVSKADGKPRARYRLDSPPVFDGMAAAQGRVVLCTLDGAVECLGAGPALPEDADGLQVISEEPAEPDYLKPPEVDKRKDFTRVARCRVIQSKLGYQLIATGKKQNGVVLNKLQDPITGTATFTARMRVPQGTGLLTNGFLAFGNGTTVEELVHCGIRYQPKKALVTQGNLNSGATAELDAEFGKVYALTVRVDLAAQTVVFTTGGVTVTAKLKTPLKKITHVGYTMDSASVQFSAIEITRE